jgi:hypothetical protein
MAKNNSASELDQAAEVADIEMELLHIDRKAQGGEIADVTSLRKSADELVLGVDWAEVGRNAFGVLHTAGKAVASAFGAGQAAQQLETAESQAGLLPPWAGGAAPSSGGAPPAMSAAPPSSAVVYGPDAIILVRKSAPTSVVQGVWRATVYGGKRLAGTGYRTGSGFTGKYSFGYDKPTGVELVAVKDRSTTMIPDVDRILFCGGREARDVLGDGGEWDLAQARLAAAQARLAASQSFKVPDVTLDIPQISIPSGGNMSDDTMVGNELSETEIVGNVLSETEIVGNELSETEIVGDDVVEDVEDVLGTVISFADEAPDEVSENDYLYGNDVLGATSVARKPRGAKVVHTPPAKKVPVRTAHPSGKSLHALAVARASRAAARALRAGTAAKARAAQYDPSKHKTVVPLQKTSVKGEIVLGATAPLTATQQAKVQKHADSLVRTKRAVDAAKVKADRALKAGKAAGGVIKKAKPVIAKLTKIVPQKTTVRGDSTDEVIDSVACRGEALLDLVGAIAFEDEIEGSIDPLYSQSGYGQESSAESSTDSSADTQPVPLPVRGQPLSQSDAQVAWQHLPEDGVTYKGDRGWPDQGFGSYNHFYGGGDGFEWHPDGWWANRGGNYSRPNDGELANLCQISTQYGWGPLIGNPNNSDTAGLQNAMADKDQWFWQSANAPTWATAEADAAITLLNQKAADANQAAQEADAARQAQDQAQQQEIQDKRDAQIALAQQKSDAENAIAQGKLDLQQQAYDQQQAAKQAAADLKNQSANAALDQQEAAAMLNYFQQHPEAMFEQQPGGGQGGEGEGGEGEGGESEGGEGEEGGEFEGVPIPPTTPDESQVDWGQERE